MSAIIPLAQFEREKYAEFDKEHAFQAASMQLIENDIEAQKRWIINAHVSTEGWKGGKWGPIVSGEPTAVTDHIDVTIYYKLVEEKD